MPTFVGMTVEDGLWVKHYGTWYKGRTLPFISVPSNGGKGWRADIQ